MADPVADALVDVSSAQASGDVAALEQALRRAMQEVPASQVEEALLQSYLFLGYPAALRAVTMWRRVSGVPAPDEPTRDESEWEARGVATFNRVYGEPAQRLRENAAALHPDLARWMLTEGYGKVLGRPGLELTVRELCIVAMLSWQDAAPQLYSHLRGALNAGVSEARVDEVVEHLCTQLDEPRRVTLRQQWESVRARRAGN